MPPDTNLIIIIRSAVGFTNHVQSIKEWVRELKTTRGFRVRLYVWEAKRPYLDVNGGEFGAGLSPIANGKLGFGAVMEGEMMEKWLAILPIIARGKMSADFGAFIDKGRTTFGDVMMEEFKARITSNSMGL